MAATAKVIELKGDPRNPESAEHIIIFPGGSISVCRTSDNQYWAHIEVYHGQILDSVRESKRGYINAIRIDTPDGVKSIAHGGATHFAVLVGQAPAAPDPDIEEVELSMFEG